MHHDSIFVLHHRWLNERQVILECIGKEHGRIQLTANKKNCPHAACLYDVTWQENASGLHRIKQCESNGPVYHLQGHFLVSLMYMHELMIAIMPVGVTQTRSFDAYCLSLHKLYNQDSIAPILRTFEQIILNDLGYGIHVDQVPDKRNGFVQYTIDSGFTWSHQQSCDNYPITTIQRILQHDYEESDLPIAKYFFSNIISQLTPNKKWYTKSIYV